jgi:hypothetical protein
VGIFDKLFGRDEAMQPQPAPRPSANAALSGDEQAIARYRYMLKTAPPETVEQAHAEAFAQLTPEQRKMLLQELSANLPDAERSAAGKDDPQSLARLATRAEVRRPGTMERTFGGMGARGGMGMGGLMAGSFLSTIAGVVIGSAIAQSFLGDSGADDTAGGEPGADDMASDASADAGSDGGDFDGGGFDEI